MIRRAILFVLLLVVIAGLFLHLFRGEPSPPSVRAIWVARFSYSTPEDVQKIFENLSARDFTDVFFQVRGNGTVYYQSELEPWAHELSGWNPSLLGKDPGWDPLQMAVELAHKNGLRLHAYINALPGWSGSFEPLKPVGQLWTKHRDWFMVDAYGDTMQPVSGWYSFLNPVHPGVREHLRGITKELCRYDIDGLHLDYIRYPYDYADVAGRFYTNATKAELKKRASFSHDELSQKLIKERYGEEPAKNQVAAFRCDSVTRLVQDLTLQTDSEGTNFIMSASVLGIPWDAKRHAYQDTEQWVKEDVLDWAVQMNYGTKRFDEYLHAMRKTVGRSGFKHSVIVGVSCRHEAKDIIRQVEAVKKSDCLGYALFSYGLLFDENHQLTKKGRTLLKKIRP